MGIMFELQTNRKRCSILPVEEPNDERDAMTSDLRSPDDRDPVAFNRRAWDQVASAGDEFYLAATAREIERARQGDWKVSVTAQKPVPREWLDPVAGKNMLLLGSGGGQQGPLLAAAGACVTVVDLSTEQLNRDRRIAAREGLDIRTVACDMANLSDFECEEFDLILNPCSVCYCSDVEPIWKECYRVLRPGGDLITGWINPVYYLFDAAAMDRGELTVRHRIPYSDFDLSESERQRLLGDRPREYGHRLDALIGLQLKAGFRLIGFYEDTWGGKDRLSEFINLFGATRARKGQDD